MAKKYAIEWDDKEVRIVVGRQRGSSLVVDQALIFPLPESDVPASNQQIGKVVSELVSSHGLSKLPAILGIGRSQVELQVLNVPPVPDEELPDLVRFQALRECSNLGEDGIVDFTKLSGDGQQLQVHAAAIARKKWSDLHKICDQAQIQIESSCVRPFGTAYLVSKQTEIGSEPVLIIDRASHSLALCVVHAGEVVLARTTKLPSSESIDLYNQALNGEIRRTILAARGKLDSATIQRLVVLGEEASNPSVQSIASDLNLPIQFLNPLAAEHISSQVQVASENTGHLAALIGMLLADADASHAKLDFVNPRRKPDPPDRRRIFSLGALTAATVVLAVGYLLFSGLWARDAEITELKLKLAKLKNSNKALVQTEQEINEIDEWLQTDIQWLDELYHLSQNMPPAEQVIADRIQMQVRNREGGSITLEGFVADPSVISKLEANLRDDRHQLLGRESKNETYGDNYQWSFQEFITILPDETDRFKPRPKSEEQPTEPDETEENLEEPAPEKTETVEHTATDGEKEKS